MKTISSLLLVIAAIALFVMYTNPQYAQIKVLQAQAEDYSKALDQSKILLAQRDSLQKTYGTIASSSLDRLNKLVPNSVDNIRLVIDINGIAARRGLAPKNIKIDGADSAKTVSTLGPNASGYGSINLSFDVSAPYGTFIDFLKDLEQSLRLVDVNSISFTSTDKGDTYDYNVSIRTYWLK